MTEDTLGLILAQLVGICLTGQCQVGRLPGTVGVGPLVFARGLLRGIFRALLDAQAAVQVGPLHAADDALALVETQEEALVALFEPGMRKTLIVLHETDAVHQLELRRGYVLVSQEVHQQLQGIVKALVRWVNELLNLAVALKGITDRERLQA